MGKYDQMKSEMNMKRQRKNFFLGAPRGPFWPGALSFLNKVP